jgi:hypothetical protein
MALDITKFQRQGGAAGQLHSYVTADAIATVIASGYFNDMTNQIEQNDMILVVASTGGTRTVDLLVVSSASRAATVTTINGT